MTTWWRMAAVVAVTTTLVACSAPDESNPPSVAPSATVTAPTISGESLPDVFTTTPPPPKPTGKATSARIPPSQPTRLDIDGAYPIHASVLPDDSPAVLEPPNGDYQHLFVWGLRGLPGDGAKDTTYIYGHTFSGPTHGVLDDLQRAVVDDHGNVIKGKRVRVTTQTGTLDYCVAHAYTVWKQDIQKQGKIWAIDPYQERGQWLVIFACFLSEDGSSQSGKNLAVLTKRC